jgi:hypothetical protein
MRALSVNACLAALSSAALVALAASGCSSSAAATSPGGTNSARPSATAPAGMGTAPSVAPSATGLAAKLLAPADLPAGWGIDASATNPAMQTECPLLNTANWNTPLGEHAEADLNAGMTGPFLVEQIAAGSADQATKAWNTLVNGLPKCTTYTHGGANGSSTFSIVRTSLPAYGDSSYSFTLSIQISTGINGNGYIVAARNGNSVVVVYIVGLTPMDKTLVESVMSKAVTKAHT